MKEYFGVRRKKGVGGQEIMVRENGKVHLLPHIKRHSPDGMNWGFGGSGPADTALSVLTDCLGPERADQLYQSFKWDYVCRWGYSWHITEEEIKTWAAEKILK